MIFILAHQQARDGACRAVQAAPDGWVVTIKEPSKSRDQEACYHAMIGEIAAQWEFYGRRWDAESMKRLLLDQFRRDTSAMPEFAEDWKRFGHVEMAPSIDGSGVVALGIQSRRFSKRLGAAFIDWLDAFGAERGVKYEHRF